MRFELLDSDPRQFDLSTHEVDNGFQIKFGLAFVVSDFIDRVRMCA